MENIASASCILCQLVAGQLPISPIYETDDILVVMDIQPVNPGHMLILPKRHLPYLADLDDAFAGRVFLVGMRVAAALRASGLRCDGVNLFLADGEAAGQEIFHAHLHVFPRFTGDGFGLRFGPHYSDLPPRSALDEAAGKIRRAFEKL